MTDISQIPIYEAAEVELRESSRKTDSISNSFESLQSLDSISSDLYMELSKVTINKKKPFVKRNVLPDLINFDAPSTSKFDDYHTMPNDSSDMMSINSSMVSEVDGIKESVESNTGRSIKNSGSMIFDKQETYSLRSLDRTRRSSSYSVLSLSDAECKTKTEDSYVFEAGYLLNLAARCEDIGDYQRAFECYKSGIEKMLIGVQCEYLNLDD